MTTDHAAWRSRSLILSCTYTDRTRVRELEDDHPKEVSVRLAGGHGRCPAALTTGASRRDLQIREEPVHARGRFWIPHPRWHGALDAPRAFASRAGWRHADGSHPRRLGDRDRRAHAYGRTARNGLRRS